MLAPLRRAAIRSLWTPANAQSLKALKEWDFAASSKITPVSGAVSSISPVTGSGALAQSTAGSRPTITAPYSAAFDGSDDFLELSTGSISQPCVHVVVTRATAPNWAAGRNITDSYQPNIINSLRQVVLADDTGKVALYAGNAVISSTTSWSTSGWSIAIGLFNGASSKVWYNGVLCSFSGNPGSDSLEGLTLGTWHSGDGEWYGDINYCGLFKGIPQNEDIDRIFGCLAHRYRIASILPSAHRFRNSPPVCWGLSDKGIYLPKAA